MRLAVNPRVRGLAPWKPQRKTVALIDQVHRVLAEYAAYLPLTLRQIFYRLVGAHDYPKNEQAYGRLGEALNRARRAGLIEFDAIRDDDANIVTSVGWDDAEELVRQWRRQAQQFRLDRQQGQPHRLLVMVEARGMVPQIESVAEAYGVPVIGAGGFDSLTAKYDLAQELGSHDGLTEVLHIGDLDPSGNHLFLSMAEDVAELIEDLSFGDLDDALPTTAGEFPGQVKFTRLAVTPRQVADLNLLTSPAKPTDRRAFDGDTVQAEAIAPDALADLVRSAILARLDSAAYRVALAKEQRIQHRLTAALDDLKLDDGGAP
jgi:hypothetical protein